jgi:arylsulfatase A-like enzyme
MFLSRHPVGWSVVALAALALGACATETPPPADEAKPLNVVFILADDLGWTDLSSYGGDLYETPRIDALATEGVRFTDAYAAAHICSPTRASIMTGKYPARLHLTTAIGSDKSGKLASPEWTQYLPLEEVTIAEALKSAGYATGHFGKWHLNKDKNYEPGRPGDPGSQGFDVVLTTHKPPRDADPEGDAHHVWEITDAAMKFIEAHRDGPFYAYVSHNTVHRPVIGRPDLVEEYEKKMKPDEIHDNPKYAAMVDELDQSVGQILDKLDELGLRENTLVIFTSDNGGFLGDEKDEATVNTPLRSGKGHMYEGGIRVPSIVRWPGVTPAGTESHEPISSVDYYPTLLEATGATGDPAHNANVDGISIVPLLKDPSAHLDREALYWHFPHYSPQGGFPSGAVRVGDLKLVEFFEDMHVELYNLKEDISESRDLAGEMTEKAEEMKTRLHEWREAVGAQMPTPVE